MAESNLGDATAVGDNATYSVSWSLDPCHAQPAMSWTAFLFPLSLLPTLYTLSVIQLVVTGFVQSILEVQGFNLGYAKFASAAKQKSIQIPSRAAYFFLYLPAAVLSALFLAAALGVPSALSFLRSTHLLPNSPVPLPPAAAAWLTASPSAAAAATAAALPSSEQWRLVLVCGAGLVHYTKRCLESVFVHRFSGTTDAVTAVFIVLHYCYFSYALLSAQWITAGASTSAAASPCSLFPEVNLIPLGLLLFVIGIIGNFHHHWILSQLRSDGSHEYRVPHGGFFRWVTCPHYLFECFDFLGVALMSQTVMGMAEFLFTLFYLSGRSIATRRWYRKKLDDYPPERRAIIPFLL